MIFILTFLTFVLAIFLLATGVIFASKRLRGSCGGAGVVGPDGEPLSCHTCPHRHKNPDCKNK